MYDAAVGNCTTNFLFGSNEDNWNTVFTLMKMKMYINLFPPAKQNFTKEDKDCETVGEDENPNRGLIVHQAKSKCFLILLHIGIH